MHDAIGTNDDTTVGLADGLVSETHPECRNGAPPAADDVDCHSGFARCARSGRNHDRRRRELPDLLDGDRVVAPDDRIRPELAQVLDEVVCEGVVVVDDENHCWSLVAGRWSLVAGRWSLVAGRWSLVAGRPQLAVSQGPATSSQQPREANLSDDTAYAPASNTHDRRAYKSALSKCPHGRAFPARRADRRRLPKDALRTNDEAYAATRPS